MERAHKYDQMIRESLKEEIKKKFGIRDDYLSKDYLAELEKAMGEERVGRFAKELTTNSKGIKICAVASSARLGFLYSVSKDDKAEFEITKINKDSKWISLTNDCCHPNYDAYFDGAFYEFKCHEFCKTHRFDFSARYQSLFNNYFHVRISDYDSGNRHESINDLFGIKWPKSFFDLKQLFCHIFGLLKYYEKTGEKPVLHYIVFKPVDEVLAATDKDSLRIRAWFDDLNKELKSVFNGINNLKVYIGNKELSIQEIMEIDYKFVSVAEVEDLND